jgi:hypothetical protein
MSFKLDGAADGKGWIRWATAADTHIIESKVVVKEEGEYVVGHGLAVYKYVVLQYIGLNFVLDIITQFKKKTYYPFKFGERGVPKHNPLFIWLASF